MSSPGFHSIPQFGAIFDAALNDYTQKTGTDLTAHPLAAILESCHSPEAILDVLREQAHAFDQYRNGDWKIRLMRHLKPTVDILLTLSTSGVLGDHGIGLFPPAKAIFAAVGHLLSTAKGVSTSYDALVELFEVFEHYLGRLKIFTEIPSAVGEVLVKIMVELLGVLSLAMQQIKQGRFRKFAKKLLGENAIEEVLQRLDRLTMEESRMTAAQTMQVVLSLFNNMKTIMDDGKASTNSIRTALVTIQEIVEDLNKIKRGQLQERIHKWISPPDPSINQNNACETHHSETATWFIQGAVYNEWKATGSVLWIQGKPGSGKSVLCSSIIKDVQGICTTGLASLAYYYFDFKDTAKQDRRGLLSSLLIQLCTRPHSGYDVLSRLHEMHDNGLRQPSDTDLIHCLKDVLALPSQEKAYIIVDAVDECPNSSGFPKTAREKVLDLLEEIVDLNLPNLRICITSRPEIDIKNVLEPLNPHQMSLHDENGQKEDILEYIRTVVLADRKMRKWRLDDKQLVIDTLSAKADGMFRWVVCQLDMLRRCFPASLCETLEELPETLDKTYEQILSSIEKEKREYAHRLFNCLAVSIRPLRVEELAEVLAMRFNAGNVPDYHVGWRLEDPYEAVLSACSSLVTIANVDGSPIVQFAHFSVKEFLTSTRLSKAAMDVSRYHIHSLSAHTIVAQASLGILLHLGDWVDKKNIGEFPFAAYAAQHWVDHGQIKGVSSVIRHAMTRLFDIDNPSFATWIWIYDIDYPLRTHMFTTHPTRPEAFPLYYATLCGFRDVVGHLVSMHPGDVNAIGGYHTAALHAALAKGNLGIAELLIEKGADVNVLDSRGSSALNVASGSGRLENVEFLLKHGADANKEDEDGTTALDKASWKGELDIARILLNHGAAVDSCDSMGWTPLYTASRYGHLDIVQLLIESGAAVDSCQKDGWTPLHAASRFGHLDTVKFLIQSRATVDSPANDGLTPLIRASQFGYLDIVRFLIESGAAVDSRQNDGWTSLLAASRYGHPDIVNVLIQNGAAVDSRQNDGWTPLFAASRYGHLEIVQSLIQSHAAVDSRQNDGWTPLCIASGQGHLDIVRFLIESGAAVDSRENNGWTSLYIASGQGHLDIVQLLVESGAAVDSRQNNGWTSLCIASGQGHLDVVRYLVQNGAVLNCRAEDGSTPLTLACLFGHFDVISDLLNQGADVNAQQANLFTPLHIASAAGHLGIAMLLIQSNAEIDNKTNAGETPLILASLVGHLEISRLLLERGSNPNAQDGAGWTPLHKAAHNGHLDIVELLIELGATLDLRNDDNRTPLDIASANRKWEVARFLAERVGADRWDDTDIIPIHPASQNSLPDVPMSSLGSREDVDPPDKQSDTLHNASEEGNLDIVMSLIAQGADVDERNADHQTPLHLASSKGRLEIAKVLIDAGADVDSWDKWGWTALHRASRLKHLEVVRLLLDRGADVNVKKQNGWSSLHLASANGYIEIVQLLLERGASVEVRNDEGRTASDEALRSGDPKIVELLLQHSARQAEAITDN